MGLIAFEGPLHGAHLFLIGLALLCGMVATLGIVYTLLAGALIGCFFARTTSEPTSFPPVTIVKPLHGDEWALLSNLSSFCQQDYPGPVQFLFGVHDAEDPALRTVEQLRLLHPEAHITVVADARLYGPNRKMSNILNMLPEARHDVLVFADSDVSVGMSYLRNVIGELQKPGVGLVTCVYRGQPDPGFWPRLSAKATNYQFLPGVVTGLALGMARPCFGQTIAMRRETLEKIGGFARFVHHLAEDYAIGEAVRMIGEKVVIPPFTVSHACVETTATKLIAHELRWSRTIRTIDPVGHLGSALIHPFAFALLTILFSGGAAWAWPLAVVALLARLALKVLSDRALRQAHRDLWLLPFWDIVSFSIFVASFLSTRVTWRGFSFKVDGNGLLSPVETSNGNADLHGRLRGFAAAGPTTAQCFHQRRDDGRELDGGGMMKHLGRIAALAGLIASLWLVVHDNPSTVLGLMRAAGAGLVLAGVAHVLPMLANARGWQILIRGANRQGLAGMLQLVWVRESVNSMLPVARIGGEVVSFRMMRRRGLRGSTAAASLVVDMQLTLISQLMFTMVGIGFLFAHAASGTLRLASDLAWGIVALAPLLVLFSLVQHASPFERLTRMLNHATSGKLAALVGQSAQIDRSIKLIWRRRGVVLRYLFFWQPLQCVLTALEIWLALYFLGVQVSFTEAVVIESLIQAVSSAAFFVPGGLGVQEGGFILIGGALGLDPSTCLALAGARRIRDLLIFVPGLFAWQFAESSSSGRGDQTTNVV